MPAGDPPSYVPTVYLNGFNVTGFALSVAKTSSPYASVANVLAIVECLTLDLVEFGAVGLDKAEVKAEDSKDGTGCQEEGVVDRNDTLDELGRGIGGQGIGR
jgi:hypothetical protein